MDSPAPKLTQLVEPLLLGQSGQGLKQTEQCFENNTEPQHHSTNGLPLVASTY